MAKIIELNTGRNGSTVTLVTPSQRARKRATMSHSIGGHAHVAAGVTKAHPIGTKPQRKKANKQAKASRKANR